MKKSYKSRGQGFTLIELLAVLVVLAILALIAIPIVIKVINNAREDSYKRSIESYARTVEMGLARWAIANPGVEFPNKLSMIVDEEEKTLIDIKGDQVYCNDEIEVSDKGEVNLFGCYTEKSKDKKKWDYIDGKVKDAENTAAITYSIGDSIKFNNEDYHVIDVPTNDNTYVVALKDEPLKYDDLSASLSSTEIGSVITKDSNGYLNTPYLYNDLCTTIGAAGCSNDYSISSIKQIIDIWSNGLSSGLTEINGYKARLITKDELVNNFEFQQNDTPSSIYYTVTINTPSWVYNSEYWYATMTSYQDSASNVWLIERDGMVDNNNVGHSFVIRPVINVKKSAITKN